MNRVHLLRHLRLRHILRLCHQNVKGHSRLYLRLCPWDVCPRNLRLRHHPPFHQGRGSAESCYRVFQASCGDTCKKALCFCHTWASRQVLGRKLRDLLFHRELVILNKKTSLVAHECYSNFNSFSYDLGSVHYICLSGPLNLMNGYRVIRN